jgi:hypothetical protein
VTIVDIYVYVSGVDVRPVANIGIIATPVVDLPRITIRRFKAPSIYRTVVTLDASSTPTHPSSAPGGGMIHSLSIRNMGAENNQQAYKRRFKNANCHGGGFYIIYHSLTSFLFW